MAGGTHGAARSSTAAFRRRSQSRTARQSGVFQVLSLRATAIAKPFGQRLGLMQNFPSPRYRPAIRFFSSELKYQFSDASVSSSKTKRRK